MRSEAEIREAIVIAENVMASCELDSPPFEMLRANIDVLRWSLGEYGTNFGELVNDNI